MNTLIRHKDKGEFLSRYMDKIFVRCPRCNNMAIVQRTNASGTGRRFSCTSCVYQMESRYSYTVSQHWFSPVVLSGHKACASCGYKYLSIRRHHPKVVANISLKQHVTCPVCNAQAMLECAWLPIKDSNNAIDPYFGLPLALQANCKHGVVWVYNLEHLAEYRAVIQADLRERGKVPNWAWIVRLPKWIKHAKNRSHVLKALRRIEALYLQTT